MKTKEQRKKKVAIPEKFVPRFWEQQDNRTYIVREIRRRVAELEHDCGAESYAQKSLCQRAVFLEMKLETLEIQHAHGTEIEEGVYTQAVNCLSGIYAKLGIKKQVAKTKGLKAYVAEKGA